MTVRRRPAKSFDIVHDGVTVASGFPEVVDAWWRAAELVGSDAYPRLQVRADDGRLAGDVRPHVRPQRRAAP